MIRIINLIPMRNLPQRHQPQRLKPQRLKVLIQPQRLKPQRLKIKPATKALRLAIKALKDSAISIYMMHVSKVNYFSLRNTNTISYHCTLNNTVLD
jgi:hypothetical protein